MRQPAVAAIVVLSTLALVLDVVDGWVARRTRTSTAFGARFDGEVDAFLILVLLRYFARRTLDPRALAAIRAVTHASAGLVLASVIPIARDALTTPWQAVLALTVTGVMVGTDWDTAWTVLAGALCGLLLG